MTSTKTKITVISLWAGQSGFQFPAGPRDYFLLKNIYICSGTHLATQSASTRNLSAYIACSYHSPPSTVRLGTSRAIPLLPLYAFMAWTGSTLPLPLTSRSDEIKNVGI